MIVAPRATSERLALSAAGFIATSTLGASPGVRMSREAKWIWKAETPCSVPAGARISAGKFGSVARSFPSTAVASVNRVPASCMPSPESPAKRTMTRSRCSTRVGVGRSVVATGKPVYERVLRRLGRIAPGKAEGPMDDDPTTAELQQAQREREAVERRAKDLVHDEREREIHARRADKAQYLREKLAERAEAEAQEE